MGRGTDDKAEGQATKVKGRVKTAAGELTGDAALKNEGRKDQLKGKSKEMLGRAKKAGQELKGK